MTSLPQRSGSVVIKTCDPWLFLWTGVMMEVLKQAGTWHVSSEVLKMPVNTRDGRLAQSFRVEGETESGPAALWRFCPQ